MKVVVNSTVLIGLCQIGQLRLLESLFEEIYISLEVYSEVVEKGKGKIGSEEIKSAQWIKRKKVKNSLAVSMLMARLDPGEAETIILAIETEANILVLDEKEAREIAEEEGLTVIGTAALLKRAKEKGLIEDLKKSLDQLRASGFRLSDDVYEACLRNIDVD